MPRASAIKPIFIIEALKNLCFVDDKGTLLPWSDDVWNKACYALNGRMSKDYIYLYLSQNRNNVFNEIHGIQTANDVESTDTIIDDTADDSLQHSNWSMDETSCLLPALRKEIHLSSTEWSTLHAHLVQYKERKYEVLVVGWTDALYDILWTHLRLPCPFAFKRAKINRNPGETFLYVHGGCSECASKINIYCQSEPSNETGATLHVSTFDSRGIAHEKKRQVSGERRLRIAKELQGKSTFVWRRDEAVRLMNFGDDIPANIPSEEVLRKAKQEARDKELGLFKAKSALASVWDMKYGQEFSGCIHEISLDKFFVMYWTPTQIFMRNKLLKEGQENSISIDATGSLVKHIPKPDGSKRAVYLYQAVCGYLGKILPLFQMVSEKHDTNTLTYWMREWLRCGGSCPKQVVTDYSLALLNAACLAFNNVDLKSYIEKSIVFDKDGTCMRVNPPKCLIRLDIAHFIKMVARWNCFSRESPEKKDFYLRCIGLLTTCTEIDDFVYLCTDILTVAFATHENIEDAETHCYAAQRRITDRLKTFNLPDQDFKEHGEQNSLILPINDVEKETVLDSSSAIETILIKMESDSKNQLNHGRLNPYYCHGFGSRLLKLSKQFVLWTAVLVVNGENTSILVSLSNDQEKRIVSSSARSEEYFRELKHLVFKKEKCIRLDKFLVIHLRSLAGTTMLLNAGKPKTIKEETEKPQFHVTQNESEFLNEKEDWRGLSQKDEAIQPKTKKRGKYVTPCPNINTIHKRAKFQISLPLLLNGNRLGPVKLNKRIIFVRNTCGFDSTVQSLLAAYNDYGSFHKFMEESNHTLLNFVQEFSRTGACSQIYTTRCEILKATTNIQHGVLDCETNVGTLIEKHLFPDVPSLKIKIYCNDCKSEKNQFIPVLDLNPDSIFKEAMRGLQEALNLSPQYYVSKSQNDCSICKGINVTKTFQGGNHIFLNIEAAEIELIAARIGLAHCRKQFTVLEIPDIMNYCGFEYKLVSAIIFADGHYYACIKRASGSWEEHNDLSSSQKIMPMTGRELLKKRRVPLLLYVKIET